VSCCCEKLVAETGDSLGTQNAVGSRYLATVIEHLTENTSVCVIVNCKVQSRAYQRVQ
jgi:hypothetical protein